MSRLPALLSLVALLACAAPASADTLLVERVQQEPASRLPSRGMSMGEVEASFGAPAGKLEPRGGQKRQWPTIQRWVYPGFTVYFETGKVIDAVANRATDSEAGPKPAIR